MEDCNIIRRVTVAGITGAIGPAIIQALATSGFTVQALTRKITKDTLLPSTVIEADYSDIHALCETLCGQDAVISCLGDTPGAVAAQRMLIEAAVAAGVKRFLPSEFGSDTTNAHVRSLPFFEAKLAHQALLQEAAMRNPGFSYSLLITGPFLDWGLSVVPFIINLGTKTAEVIDGGNVRFSITRTGAVASAVAKILKHPEQTKNRALFVHEAVVTQNQLIAHGEHVLASLPTESPISAQITPKAIDSDLAEPLALSAHANNSTDPLEWILPCINLSIWAKDEPCRFVQTDNELLGIKELDEAELNNMLYAEMKAAAEKLGFKETADGNKIEAEKAFEEGKRKLVEAEV